MKYSTIKERSKGSASAASANVETYSRDVEYKSRWLAQKGGSTLADRKAVADAVRRDADQVFNFILRKAIRAAR